MDLNKHDVDAKENNILSVDIVMADSVLIAMW